MRLSVGTLSSAARIMLAGIVFTVGAAALQESLAPRSTGFLSFPGFLAVFVFLAGAEIMTGAVLFNNKRQFLQLLPGLIALLIIFAILLHRREEQMIERAPSLFSARTWPADQALFFDFKPDGDLVIRELSAFSETRFSGKYQRRGDTVNILHHNYRGFYGNLPREGRVKGDTLFWKGFQKMLLEKPAAR